jgi:hypothetical protein
MVSRSAAVKFRARTIDNLRVYIITKYNSKTLIQTVFLVRQPALHLAICGGGGGDQWARCEAESNGRVPRRATSRRKFHQGSIRPSRTEAAEYIGSLLEGLQSLAQEAQMPFLTYLLTMALEEAKTEKAKAD